MSIESASEVTILLATLNGANWLRPQLESFAAQNHNNWRLIVSDDGSTDQTNQILSAFERSHRGHEISRTAGPRRGFANNFLHLLRAAGPAAPFIALSDQDDVWLPDKLGRALASLGKLPEELPALYCGRTWVCDSALNPQVMSPEFRRPPCFRNALLQSIGGGNTMVLNNAALTVAQAASREISEIVSHDWWLYQLVTGAGGVVIYDPVPTVLYRQHGQNLVGANHSAAARAKRVALTLRGRFRQWNDINIAALTACSHRFASENRILLEAFARARGRRPRERLQLLRDTGLHRQTRAGNASFLFAAALGLV